jgi:hypothetical protein
MPGIEKKPLRRWQIAIDRALNWHNSDPTIRKHVFCPTVPAGMHVFGGLLENAIDVSQPAQAE